MSMENKASSADKGKAGEAVEVKGASGKEEVPSPEKTTAIKWFRLKMTVLVAVVPFVVSVSGLTIKGCVELVMGWIERTQTERIRQKCEPSMVVIDREGQKASGFIAEANGKKYVYTVRHAIMDMEYSNRFYSNIKVTTTDGGKAVAIDSCECADASSRLLIGGEWVDAVRFETRTSIPALRFSSGDVAIGDKIFALGCEDGEPGMVKVRVGKICVVNDNNPLYLQHDADTSVGFSGGPLVDSSGDVVAMDSFEKSKVGKKGYNDCCYAVRLMNSDWVSAYEIEKASACPMRGVIKPDFDGNRMLVYTDVRGRAYEYKSFISPISEEEKDKFTNMYILKHYKPSNVYTVALKTENEDLSDSKENETELSSINVNTFMAPEIIASLADCLYSGQGADGQGVDANLPLAAHLYEVAAKKGNALAQFNTGVCYANGSGVDKDDSLAFKWYLVAAENNEMHAQYWLASLYSIGRGCEKNEAEERRWLEASAVNGFVAAECAFGVYLLVRGESSAAFQWFEKAGNDGYPDGLAHVGQCYEHGWGVARDESLALESYRKAKSMGSALAELLIGLHYLRLGCYEDALKCIESARAMGDAEASLALGQCYEHGIGVERDASRAEELFQESADRGCVTAITMMGVSLMDNQEFEKGFCRFVEASSLGDPEAKACLGLCYEMGWCVCPNMKIALDYYRDAARLGSVFAHVALGECLMYGNGCDTNLTEAVALLLKASERGNPVAQYDIGCCYAEGLGVESNATIAVQWYEKASERDYLPACHELGVCYSEGFGVEPDMEKAIGYFRRAERYGFLPSIEALERLASDREKASDGNVP